jgi:peptide chain release factor 1
VAETPSSSSTSSTPCTRSSRLGNAFSFSLEVLTDRPGYLAFRVSGRDAARAFHNEQGGHRFQRVPPTERKGRVHSSTITVAVMSEPTATEVKLHDKDLIFKATRGSGPGGQHRNKTASAIQLTHKPTGIMVRAESEKSQHRNKEAAKALLRARIAESLANKKKKGRDAKRRKQVGTAERADKRRTVALQRGQVVDHRTGKKVNPKKYLRGEIEKLWR